MDLNIFDEVLGLEEKFYDGGFRQGFTDGVQAGQVEGRTFGLEKGFEKYLENGKLYGKSLVWANRVPQFRKTPGLTDPILPEPTSRTIPKVPDPKSVSPHALPALPNNERLAKHIKVLHALSESESLSTKNTEEAVSDFDDRLKRSQAKEKIIEKMIGNSQEI